MKVEIKDKDSNITRALNLLGLKVNSLTVNLILNVSEYVSKKGGDTSIRDLCEIEALVNGLYDVDKKQLEDGK